jgi:ketosteroid isomerase-like protein
LVPGPTRFRTLAGNHRLLRGHTEMDAIERVVARDEIRQLACRYALATDSRNLDELVELFVEDVQVGPDTFGRPALRANFETQLRGVGVTILFVGNHLIDFESDALARGHVYCRAEIQDGDRWIQQAILYRDLYRRDQDRWLFVRRNHRLWYGAEAASNPLAQEPANWPQNHSGRGTLPEEWETWGEFWRETN